jgi:ATP-binding cassette, subfamily G (WHITE), member 1
MEKYSLEYRDIVLDVVNLSKNISDPTYKRLLRGLSGKFESGKLTAIMGASGSAKTTFISVVAGRVHPDSKTYGDILFRGVPRNKDTWLKQVAYLEQDDCIVPQQTVREYIEFALATRGSFGSASEITRATEKIMSDLHLDRLQDIKLEAVSGGERKRVMIAVEIAIEPEILILDEPTSGLDSHLALELADMLKKYAVEKNRIVVTTVHQPGSGLFEMFDNLLFMHQGTAIYNGPVSEVEEFFASKGMVRNEKLSKAEFLFELFTERSIFPEFTGYRETVVELARDIAGKAEAQVEGKPLKRSNDTYIPLKPKLGNAFLLFKRTMVHDWRTWRVLKQCLGELFLFSLYSFFIVVIPSFVFNKLFKDKGVTLTLGDPRANAVILKNTFGDIYPDAVEAICMCAYIFLGLICFFNGSTLLDNTAFLHREMIKGSYNFITLYLAYFLLETFYSTLRVLFSFGLCAIIGLEAGIRVPYILNMFLLGYTITLTNILTRCISSAQILQVILSAGKVMLLIHLNPLALEKVADFVTRFKPIAFLKYVIKGLGILWAPMFAWAHISVNFHTRILSSWDKKSKDTDFIEFIKGLSTFQRYFGSLEEIKEDLKVPLFGKRDVPDYIFLVLLVVSLALLVMLSNLFLYRRFSPPLRLKLRH